ncbi:MAG: hypothetical protein JNJ54_22725 [Myxococcaceae bacterium]|nr:hypothetical protein [Myxococcaceae bacterium]
MRRALLLLLASWLPACGPEGTSAEPGFDLELVVQRGLLDTIGGFQVALVTNISSIENGDCTVIRQRCIKDQVPTNRFVPLKNPQTNQPQVALVFPINLKAGTPNTQDLTLTEVPPGRDYGLIIEAIAKDGVRLAGAECQFVPQLSAGSNPRVLMRIQQYDPPKMCDPRLVP